MIIRREALRERGSVKLSGLTTLFLGLAAGSASIVVILVVALTSGPLV